MSADRFSTLTWGLPEVVNLHEADAVLDALESMEQDGVDNPDDGDGLDEDEQEQLDSLRALKDAMGGDWDSTAMGIALISESYWQEYAQESAYEFGMVERESSIEPYIDWEKWADAMQQDYTEITVDTGIFEGTWWYRL